MSTSQTNEDCSCDSKINADCGKTYVDPCVFQSLAKSCNDFTTINATSLSKLYKTFIDSGGPDGLNFHNAIQNINITNARKQIIYDMCQLAAARVVCEEGYTPGKSHFSGHWWKKTIWGQYPIQNVIYILSLMVMFYLNIKILTEMVIGDSGEGVFSFISPTLKEMTNNVGPGDGNMVPIIITIISLLVLLTIVVNYMTRERNESDEEMDEKRKRGVVVILTIAFFVFVFSFGFNMIQGENTGGVLGVLSDLFNLSSLSMFLLFNFAISAYIPQLMLVAIILQRFFFTPWSFDFSSYETGFGALSRILAFTGFGGVISWYWYHAGSNKGPAQTVSYVFFSLLILMFGQSAFMAAKGKMSNNKDSYESTWALVMMPIFQMAFSFFRKDMTIADIMVKNSKIF